MSAGHHGGWNCFYGKPEVPRDQQHPYYIPQPAIYLLPHLPFTQFHDLSKRFTGSPCDDPGTPGPIPPNVFAPELLRNVKIPTDVHSSLSWVPHQSKVLQPPPNHALEDLARIKQTLTSDLLCFEASIERLESRYLRQTATMSSPTSSSVGTTTRKAAASRTSRAQAGPALSERAFSLCSSTSPSYVRFVHNISRSAAISPDAQRFWNTDLGSSLYHRIPDEPIEPENSNLLCSVGTAIAKKVLGLHPFSESNLSITELANRHPNSLSPSGSRSNSDVGLGLNKRKPGKRRCSDTEGATGQQRKKARRPASAQLVGQPPTGLEM